MTDIHHSPEKPRAMPQATSREFLTFKLGAEEYEIGIQNVQELRDYPRILLFFSYSNEKAVRQIAAVPSASKIAPLSWI